MLFQLINSDSQPEGDSDTGVKHLVELAQQGQQDAFEELVFRYRDSVYGTAWHLTRNTEDALDVTQEAFVRAYRALGSYKGRSRFSTWLHRIVLNTGIDYLRRENRHRHEPVNTDRDGMSRDDLEPAGEPSQREKVYESELHKQVLAAVDQLSQRQRQAFILRYFHDLDTRETALVLKCTEGSVKRHLFRAQKRLKILLSDIRMPDHER